MAKEYIEREALDRELQNLVKEYNRYCESERSSGAFEALYKLRLFPTADVAEVVHGEWVDKQNPQWKAYDIRHCSMCGWNIPKSKLRNKDLHWNYCPNCGAKMDGERKEV